MKHYTSHTASTEKTHVSASANSDGIHVTFYHGPMGMDGATTILLDDEASRFLSIVLQAAIARREGR